MRLVLLSISLLALATSSAAGEKRRIQLSTLRDKVAGGWAGQMIGVSYGAPTEFRYRGQVIPEDKLPRWSPEKVANSIDQDDLYVDMTFAQVLDDKGIDATTEDFGAMFRNARYRLWHANLAARRALKRGVPATLSGTPKYNAHANDIDFQIEADFIGMMAPGLPQSSNAIAWRAGRVMNYGDGIYGGMFVSCMYSAAFFEKDPQKLVEAGLACLPARSDYARTIKDVLDWHKQYPADWIKNWELLEQKWNRDEPCPEGALQPFNIDAKLNGAYIALGLLYGNGDFEKTIVISTRAGQDSDCNPSSAAGVLGVVYGYDAIPEKWKSGIAAISSKTFSFTNYTFPSIVDSTVKRATALVLKKGGQLDGQALVVNTEEPTPAKLEAWNDYGKPAERISASDARVKRAGAWAATKSGFVANEKGASAEFSFEGTGFILVGPYIPDGGKADVFVDGKIVATIDSNSDEDATKSGESLYHDFSLNSAPHVVRILVRGEPVAWASGSRVGLDGLVVFRR